MKKYIAKVSQECPTLLPLIIGFITGLNICPPFLLAFTRATATGSLLQSMLFFIMFFWGTSVYFLPVPLLGFLNRFSKLRTVGKFAVFIMAFFYLVIGIAMVVKGISNVDILRLKHIMNSDSNSKTIKFFSNIVNLPLENIFLLNCMSSMNRTYKVYFHNLFDFKIVHQSL